MQVTTLGGIASDSFVPAINATLAKYSINTPRRIRYFLAQSLYETMYYTHWSENLLYTTPERLATVFPREFNLDGSNGEADAHDYVNDAVKLGNFIYANRNGNGDEASGDGYNFRGRGGFHLTGRGNYLAYSTEIYGDDRIVKQPDLVAAPSDAFLSAGSFWNRRGLNALADADQFTLTTARINGGTASVPDRLKILDRLNAMTNLIA